MGVDPAIDITAAERSTVLALLERHLPGTTAWVYGSRAKWTSTPRSDLDLVVFSTPEQRRQVGDLREAFEDSNLPFRVDLFVWDEVPESFRDGIKAEHSVFGGDTERIDSDGWRETTLGEVITLKRGYDLPKHRRVEGAVPVVSSSGVTDYHSESRVPGPGVVTGRYGTLGKVFFIPDAFWPLNTALYVRDFKGNDPRFISYFLRSLDFSSCSDKAAVPGINRNHLHEEIVRIPATVGEQRAIAHVLGTLDDKMELNRRMNATLEALARALFKSWFVDFDPVRAKMEGRDTGLPKDIVGLFPCRLVESETGEVPIGWEVAPLSNIIDVNPTRRLRKGQMATYLDMANMPTTGHTPHTVVDRPYGSGMRFTSGDTLVARITPCLENGKTAYVDFLQSGAIGWGSTEYIVMRPRPPLPTEFGYCLARSPHFREFLIRNMSGTSGRQRVPAQALSQFMCISPSARVAQAFGKIVQSVMARASAAACESRRVSRIRDTLLPRLIAGQLRTNRFMEERLD